MLHILQTVKLKYYIDHDLRIKHTFFCQVSSTEHNWPYSL